MCTTFTYFYLNSAPFGYSFANKFDSFDTRVSETIELFLLPKSLAGQGLSAFSILVLVSLWSEGTYAM